jgi:hypothetical protein
LCFDQRNHAPVINAAPTRRNAMTTTLDQRLAALKPAQTIRISGDDQIWVTAERSGDGKTLRFVRHTPTTSTVFRTCRF